MCYDYHTNKPGWLVQAKGEGSSPWRPEARCRDYPHICPRKGVSWQDNFLGNHCTVFPQRIYRRHGRWTNSGTEWSALAGCVFGHRQRHLWEVNELYCRLALGVLWTTWTARVITWTRDLRRCPWQPSKVKVPLHSGLSSPGPSLWHLTTSVFHLFPLQVPTPIEV